MSSRSQRAAIANETLEILERGAYTNSFGNLVVIAPRLEDSVNRTIHISPESFDEIFRQRDAIVARQGKPVAAKFIVKNTTTLAAACELLCVSATPVMCLNFASAKNPGGGFLNGSQAQEESLARSGGLYYSIDSVQQYYEFNRNCGTSLYSDHMIYSPSVPFFRNDADELIDEPYFVSVLTSPAVNRGAVENNEPQRLPEVEPTMLSRIDKLLAVATVRGYKRLVLGAWGCGVFRNDPAEVARWFATHLNGETYRGIFETVYFAVLDNSASHSQIAPFHDCFSKTPQD